MKSSGTFCCVFHYQNVGKGNQHGGRQYDLQNWLMTSHETLRCMHDYMFISFDDVTTLPNHHFLLNFPSFTFRDSFYTYSNTSRGTCTSCTWALFLSNSWRPVTSVCLQKYQGNLFFIGKALGQAFSNGNPWAKSPGQIQLKYNSCLALASKHI